MALLFFLPAPPGQQPAPGGAPLAVPAHSPAGSAQSPPPYRHAASRLSANPKNPRARHGLPSAQAIPCAASCCHRLSRRRSFRHRSAKPENSRPRHNQPGVQGIACGCKSLPPALQLVAALPAFRKAGKFWPRHCQPVQAQRLPTDPRRQKCPIAHPDPMGTQSEREKNQKNDQAGTPTAKVKAPVFRGALAPIIAGSFRATGGTIRLGRTETSVGANRSRSLSWQ